MSRKFSAGLAKKSCNVLGLIAQLISSSLSDPPASGSTIGICKFVFHLILSRFINSTALEIGKRLDNAQQVLFIRGSFAKFELSVLGPLGKQSFL